MKDNLPELEILLFVLIGLIAVPAIVPSVCAAPLKLPPGIVLDLTLRTGIGHKNPAWRAL